MCAIVTVDRDTWTIHPHPHLGYWIGPASGPLAEVTEPRMDRLQVAITEHGYCVAYTTGKPADYPTPPAAAPMYGTLALLDRHSDGSTEVITAK